ncbi:MAG: hypothetical protein JWL83_2639 [Actinomycetia bacterium]|nr:hypothetical protein [Actinomycetes bacterium]
MGGRLRKPMLVASAFMLSCASFGIATAAPAAAAGPACTFNGGTLPIALGVEPGSTIDVVCTGLAPLHPYLTVGTSLALAVDPAAEPLLSGNIVSLGALNALLAALQELDLQTATTHLSDLSGGLAFTYTVPSTQPLDPNTPCPPTKVQYNSGLIGCAFATIDLLSFKTVGAASAAYEYKGAPLFPPAPTMVLSTRKATPGQHISIGDAPGATTYWWISTLNKLQGELSGSGSTPPTITVTLKHGKTVVSADNDIVATPAVYSNGVFTPPTISGGFTVPPGLHGGQKVTVQISANLLGIPLNNTATGKIKVK